MAAGQVVAFPEHLARARVQARRPKAAEVDIDPARLNHRRRRGVTIHRSAVAERFRVVAVKHFFVEANLAGFGIHTDGEEVMAILRRRGQPDLAAHHHRRGPAAIGNLRFPFDVVRLAPVQREADGFGVARGRDMAIAPRPAELRPVRSCCRPAKGQQNQRQEGKKSAGLTRHNALPETKNGLLS